MQIVTITGNIEEVMTANTIWEAWEKVVERLKEEGFDDESLEEFTGENPSQLGGEKLFDWGTGYCRIKITEKTEKEVTAPNRITVGIADLLAIRQYALRCMNNTVLTGGSDYLNPRLIIRNVNKMLDIPDNAFPNCSCAGIADTVIAIDNVPTCQLCGKTHEVTV